jgi:hypothetical protein
MINRISTESVAMPLSRYCTENGNTIYFEDVDKNTIFHDPN